MGPICVSTNRSKNVIKVLNTVSKPGVSNLNELWFTAGTVISLEVQVVQKNQPNKQENTDKCFQKCTVLFKKLNKLQILYSKTKLQM